MWWVVNYECKSSLSHSDLGVNESKCKIMHWGRKLMITLVKCWTAPADRGSWVTIGSSSISSLLG